ncbi:MAG: transglycosylase SLT domain-containing protein [Bacteroidetes bacterium]|nr:transglycosylase SLT domain-containing protein [Bacteroidota bacterium]
MLYILLAVNTGLQAQYSTFEVTPSFKDDPIAEMLDSLDAVNYLDRSLAKPPFPRYNKYHFSEDSVPRYDEFVYEARLAKLDAQSPFDLQYNPAVKGYIELYTVRKRELVSRIMALSQLYYPIFEQALDRHNMPLELKHLAVIESALNPVAKSRAAACGLWQFMYYTGKMYNLNVTSYVDERSDVYKSTEAACQYLKYLYGLFGDWQMVLAAYNGGPGTVNKAIRRSGGKKTYWEIRPFLQKETQGYAPAFIAANYVMNYTAEHNIYSAIPKKIFFQVDTVAVKQAITFGQLSSVLNMPIDEIQYLNPCYKKNFIPSPPSNGEPYTLCLPSAKIGSFITNEQAIYDYLKRDTVTSKAILASQEQMKTHTVRKGEKITTIANKYRCSVADIKSWNSLKSAYIKPGQKLTIYMPANKSLTQNPISAPIKAVASTTATKPVTTKAAEVVVAGEYKYHILKAGDNLWSISKEYNLTLDELKKMNNFGSYYKLLPGDKIKVGKGG